MNGQPPTINRRQLRYPWARPYYPTVPRPPHPGGLLSLLAANPPEPNPALTLHDIEDAMARLWEAIGNDQPTTLVMSAHTFLVFDWKLRVWRRIRRHLRRANPRRKR